MAGFDTEILTEMLRQIKAGDRCGLSPDVFAAVFPPGHHDPMAFAAAKDFAAALRCDIDYWRATNEVFFTKRLRAIARQPLPRAGARAG